jgi:hypothetical protein
MGLAFVVDLPHALPSLDVAKLQVAFALLQVQAFLDTNASIELGLAVPKPREMTFIFGSGTDCAVFHERESQKMALSPSREISVSFEWIAKRNAGAKR